MDRGRLNAFGGLVELGGLASAGTVGLNDDGNNSRLSFPNSVERSDVFLSDRAQVNVFAGNGGSITINARNLEMTGGSFLRAGARSTLASLWQIGDDSTALFVSEFYHQLTTGKTTAEALREAQLKLLSSSQYTRPLYWATYVLVGNWL